MMNRKKTNRVASAPGPRIATPGPGRPGRSGSARRARAGARPTQGPVACHQAPKTAIHPVANPYEAFYAASADGVGLLDPGFDDWDLDPRLLVGLPTLHGDERDDT